MTTAPSPPPGGTRAKDTDRQAVVDALSDAHASGQLTFDEYDERSRAASAAVTLEQLGRLTTDLQNPPAIAAPGSAGQRGPVVVDLAGLAAVSPAKTFTRAILAMAVLFAVVIGVVAAVAAVAGGGSLSGDKPDLQHAAGFDAFVADVADEFGGTEVASAVIYPEYAVVYVPVPDHPGYERSYYYDGEFDEPGSATPRGSDDGLVDLAELDGAVAEQLIAEAPEPLGVPDPDSVYLTLESWGDPAQPAFQVYASGEFGSGYLVAAADGHLLDAYPVTG